MFFSVLIKTHCLFLAIKVWERRSSHVTQQQEEMWQLLKPSHMSEEEELANGKLLRRRPDWRSQELNTFLDELDAKANTAILRRHEKSVC